MRYTTNHNYLLLKYNRLADSFINMLRKLLKYLIIVKQLNYDYYISFLTVKYISIP